MKTPSSTLTTFVPKTQLTKRTERERALVELDLMLDSGDSMGELTQARGEVVYSSQKEEPWRALLNWLGFVFRVFSEIIEGAFSNYPLLSFSSFNHHPLPLIEHQPLQIESDSDSDHRHRPLQRLTVVLDLDETLICAYETSSLPTAILNHAIKAGVNWFDMECVCSDKEVEGTPKINYVTVFERPGLREFLKQLSEFADLVVFTAGLEGYASPLVDRIDTENRISQRLYRPSTISTEYREHVKDLSCISNDLCRVVIVDNNPYSFLLQPDNGIPCVPFSADRPHDTQLLDVILPLLKNLSDKKDVRHALYETFNMPEWFQRQGIPASR